MYTAPNFSIFKDMILNPMLAKQPPNDNQSSLTAGNTPKAHTNPEDQ